MKFVAIDFETANYSPNSACAIGLVSVENNIITQQQHFLIQPPTKEFIFTYIHGISWQQVSAAATFQQLWPQITEILAGADFFAAHNARFDQNVLQECCNFYHLPYPKQEFICSVQLARKTWCIYPTKLPNVCSYLNIELNHHQALSDARACAQILIAALSPKKIGCASE
jgi:DNA polymerase III subunit epsilon